MQLKKNKKKNGNLINEVRTISNGTSFFFVRYVDNNLNMKLSLVIDR